MAHYKPPKYYNRYSAWQPRLLRLANTLQKEADELAQSVHAIDQREADYCRAIAEHIYLKVLGAGAFGQCSGRKPEDVGL